MSTAMVDDSSAGVWVGSNFLRLVACDHLHCGLGWWSIERGWAMLTPTTADRQPVPPSTSTLVAIAADVIASVGPFGVHVYVLDMSHGRYTMHRIPSPAECMRTGATAYAIGLGEVAIIGGSLNGSQCTKSLVLRFRGPSGSVGWPETSDTADVSLTCEHLAPLHPLSLCRRPVEVLGGCADWCLAVEAPSETAGECAVVFVHGDGRAPRRIKQQRLPEGCRLLLARLLPSGSARAPGVPDAGGDEAVIIKVPRDANAPWEELRVRGLAGTGSLHVSSHPFTAPTSVAPHAVGACVDGSGTMTLVNGNLAPRASPLHQLLAPSVRAERRKHIAGPSVLPARAAAQVESDHRGGRKRRRSEREDGGDPGADPRELAEVEDLQLERETAGANVGAAGPPTTAAAGELETTLTSALADALEAADVLLAHLDNEADRRCVEGLVHTLITLTEEMREVEAEARVRVAREGRPREVWRYVRSFTRGVSLVVRSHLLTLRACIFAMRMVLRRFGDTAVYLLALSVALLEDAEAVVAA